MINFKKVIFLTRIVVFSDTHRQIKDAIRVLENMVGVDAVIHLGDCVADGIVKIMTKDGYSSVLSIVNHRK